MHYTYILKSKLTPNETYIGYTSNLKRRLTEHNQGKSKYTRKFKPWKIHAYFAFERKELAMSFEKYLKSHSGRAFKNKHFN